MHIYFSGIGGTGIGPLALIAHQAGFMVSGSDKQGSQYIEYLRKKGIEDITIDQSYEHIAAVHEREAIDWFVHTSALTIENPDAPEIRFCQEHNIKTSRRDEFINLILMKEKLKLIAIAGTHGKTTTTAMMIWLFKQLGLPLSYSVGAKISFGEMGEYQKSSEYFVYEADEFDRNFLAFHPHIALIVGVDWDHPDIYPTHESYNQAFRDFLDQSEQAVLWEEDIEHLNVTASSKQLVLNKSDPAIELIALPGLVNRQDAWEVANTVQKLTGKPLEELLAHLSKFPGVSRRFEKLAPNLYTDYAHTPPKIRGALQLAHEVAGKNVVVVYEGLHNTRQHFIKQELEHLFDDVKKLYIVPSYLAREDKNLLLLTPSDLRDLLSREVQSRTEPSELNTKLAKDIQIHLDSGDLVLCLTAGGGHSLDEWLRAEFQK
jgi:UDP-N-acetylmuramate--alanine ligase